MRIDFTLIYTFILKGASTSLYLCGRPNRRHTCTPMSRIVAGMSTASAVELGDLTLHCDEELSLWLDNSWYLMTPLLVSLGCALLIEMLMVCYVNLV